MKKITTGEKGAYQTVKHCLKELTNSSKQLKSWEKHIFQKKFLDIIAYAEDIPNNNEKRRALEKIQEYKKKYACLQKQYNSQTSEMNKNTNPNLQECFKEEIPMVELRTLTAVADSQSSTANTEQVKNNDTGRTSTNFSGAWNSNSNTLEVNVSQEKETKQRSAIHVYSGQLEPQVLKKVNNEKSCSSYFKETESGENLASKQELEDRNDNKAKEFQHQKMKNLSEAKDEKYTSRIPRLKSYKSASTDFGSHSCSETSGKSFTTDVNLIKSRSTFYDQRPSYESEAIYESPISQQHVIQKNFASVQQDHEGLRRRHTSVNESSNLFSKLFSSSTSNQELSGLNQGEYGYWSRTSESIKVHQEPIVNSASTIDQQSDTSSSSRRNRNCEVHQRRSPTPTKKHDSYVTDRRQTSTCNKFAMQNKSPDASSSSFEKSRNWGAEHRRSPTPTKKHDPYVTDRRQTSTCKNFAMQNSQNEIPDTSSSSFERSRNWGAEHRRSPTPTKKHDPYVMDRMQTSTCNNFAMQNKSPHASSSSFEKSRNWGAEHRRSPTPTKKHDPYVTDRRQTSTCKNFAMQNSQNEIPDTSSSSFERSRNWGAEHRRSPTPTKKHDPYVTDRMQTSTCNNFAMQNKSPHASSSSFERSGNWGAKHRRSPTPTKKHDPYVTDRRQTSTCKNFVMQNSQNESPDTSSSSFERNRNRGLQHRSPTPTKEHTHVTDRKQTPTSKNAAIQSIKNFQNESHYRNPEPSSEKPKFDTNPSMKFQEKKTVLPSVDKHFPSDQVRGRGRHRISDNNQPSSRSVGPLVAIHPETPPVEIAQEAQEEVILDVHQFFQNDLDLNSLNPTDPKSLDVILQHALTFQNKVFNFAEEKHSLEYFVLDEKLQRMVDKLDRMKFQDERTTSLQISVIKYITKLQSELDVRAKE